MDLSFDSPTKKEPWWVRVVDSPLWGFMLGAFGGFNFYCALFMGGWRWMSFISLAATGLMLYSFTRHWLPAFTRRKIVEELQEYDKW